MDECKSYGEDCSGVVYSSDLKPLDRKVKTLSLSLGSSSEDVSFSVQYEDIDELKEILGIVGDIVKEEKFK